MIFAFRDFCVFLVEGSGIVDGVIGNLFRGDFKIIGLFFVILVLVLVGLLVLLILLVFFVA